MCDKCKALDLKILHRQRFTKSAFDPVTMQRAEGLIAELRKTRAAMHPMMQSPSDPAARWT